ncbi:MAG: prolipoprotein diacylglyceryl transferase [Candidatus Omnitrophica bacterium]|nr:prolipoprotein diacylglyceryl transferase [Candidatus Omnitrophota bacterium]
MYPVLLQFGPFSLRTYGVLVSMALLLGYWIFLKETKRVGIDSEQASSALILWVLLGLLGARLYYMLAVDLLWVLRRPWDLPALWKGGLAIHGGVLGGILGVLWTVRKTRVPFATWADAAAPALALGQAVGRVGCFFAGCCYGKITHVPWAVVFTHPQSFAPPNLPLHPTQLYEALLDLGIFGVLWGVRKRVRPGETFALYLILYGLVRLGVESLRWDRLTLGSRLSLAMIVSLSMVAAASVWLILTRRKKP